MREVRRSPIASPNDLHALGKRGLFHGAGDDVELAAIIPVHRERAKIDRVAVAGFLDEVVRREGPRHFLPRLGPTLGVEFALTLRGADAFGDKEVLVGDQDRPFDDLLEIRMDALEGRKRTV